MLSINGAGADPPWEDTMTLPSSPTLAVLVAVAALALAPAARAELPGTVRIGVLNDMSGPYADLSGPGSVVAARLAAEDFAREAPGAFPVEILFADHQNKADVGAAVVRRWMDVDGVAAVVDVPNSAVGLAVNEIMRQKDRTFLASSVATSDLTGPACAPTTVHWTMDTWAVANGTARSLLRQGGSSWAFIASDYALGKSLERDTTAAVKAAGGQALGTQFMPLGSTDYSAPLLQAQSSGAKVIALALAGTDAVNAIKQAAEFGIGRDGAQRLAGLLIFTTDIDALGLPAAQGLLLTEAFYWDLNEATRAWSRRFAAGHGGRMPTANHAGVYSSTLAYLRAVRAAGTVAGTQVVAQMRAAPMDDALFGRAVLRTDGRVTHPMYLFQVKQPTQSTGRWDYYNVVATIPAEQAFRPLDPSCPIVRAGATQ